MVQTIVIQAHQRVWEKTARQVSAIDKIPARKPEALEAIRGGSRFAEQVYGRPIPYVIGTGPVDGMPVYGGAATVVTTTTTTTQAAEQQPAAAWVPPYYSHSHEWLAKNVVTTAPTVTTTTDTKDFVSTGNLLARNFAGDPYEIVQIVIDGTIMLDRQQTVPATVKFSFLDGLQTVPNPLVVSESGRNLLHASDIQLFINGYEDSKAPSVKAVISETPSSPVSFTDIEWTGTAPSVNIDAFDSGYDPIDGILYQGFVLEAIPGVTGIWMVALDVADHREIYRVQLENGEDATSLLYIYPLHGTSYVLVRLSTSGAHRHVLYNATTGAEITRWEETAASAGINWYAQMPFKSKFLFIGAAYSSSTYLNRLHMAIVDPVNGTIEIKVDPATVTTIWGSMAPGRQAVNFSSFFLNNGSTLPFEVFDIHEVVWDGENLDVRFLHTSPYAVLGTIYDAETDTVVLPLYQDASNKFIRGLDPDTGAVTFTITSAVQLADGQRSDLSGFMRFWPLPGFVFLTTEVVDGFGSHYGDIYLFDINARTLTLWASTTGFNPVDAVFVQSLGAYYVGQGRAKWLEIKVASFSPDDIGLELMLRRIHTLSGWESGDLDFSGFTGVGLPGFVIDRDTNTQGPTNLLSQIFDFAYADIGSGMYFQKTARDAGFAADAVIPEADLIRKDGISVISSDDPDNRMPARLVLDYISTGSGYQRRQVTSVRPAGLYDVTGSLREDTISAPVVLRDDDAVQLVHERHFSLLDYQRTHSFELPPKYARLVPGNVVQIELSTETIVAEITKVSLRPNHSLAFEAKDFQTAVTTTLGVVDAAEPLLPFIPASGFASRYIDIDATLWADADDLGGTGHRRYGVLCGRGQDFWYGAVKFEGSDPDALSASVVQVQLPYSFVGSAETALAAPADPWVTDEDNSLTIRMVNGFAEDLVSVTQAEMLEGANRFVLGKPGRWEILGCRDVVDNGDNTFTLSGLIRGWRGTEVHSGDHQIGDEFYLYNERTLHSQAYDPAFFGDTRYFKAVGIGSNPLYGTIVAHTIEGNAEKPYAPVNIAASIVGSDIVITWDWRSRLSHLAILTGAADTVHGEASLSFEVDILDSSAVVQTITVSTNTATYLDADIIADFGSMPATINVEVYQISALVGRGYVGAATITL